MKKIGIIVSLCLMAIVGNVKAQDATLQETLDFISKKTKAYHPFDVDDDKSFKFTDSPLSDTWKINSDNSIKIGFRMKKFDESSSLDFHEEYLYIDLNSEITLDSNDEKIFIKGLKSMNYISKKNGQDENKVRYYDSFFPIFYGSDTSRLLKAYKHLFELLKVKYTIYTPPVEKF